VEQRAFIPAQRMREQRPSTHVGTFREFWYVNIAYARRSSDIISLSRHFICVLLRSRQRT
jgi:hypothetical protein